MAQGPKDAARPQEDELSVQMMGAVIAVGPRDRSQFCVLNALANYADDFGYACPSLQTIADDSRCDLRTAIRQIAELEDAGWICCFRKVLNGKSNVYLLNLEKLGVTVSPTAKRSPLFARLLRTSGDRMTPIFRKRKVASEIVQNPVELMLEDENSGDMDEFSGDNPQPPQVTNSGSQVTKIGGSSDIACHTNRYNHQFLEPSGTVNEVEPTPLPPVGGGARPPVEIPSQATADRSKWNVVKNALKLELTSMSKHPNFRRLDPEQDDYDACFRDWWFDRIERSPRQWDFMTSAAVPVATERGVEKYGKRVEWLLRQYFPIPKTATVRVLVFGAGAVSDAARAGPASAELAAS